MGGQSYSNADIRTYVSGGAFLEYEGVDKNAVTDAMTNMLIGTSVNQLYRTQKIFVMGGGACGDNQGIGSGPQEAVVCRDGKAWYLYYWQENDVISTTSHQWGWVASPPGADSLGQSQYSGVTVEVRSQCRLILSCSKDNRISSTLLLTLTTSLVMTTPLILPSRAPRTLLRMPGRILAQRARLGRASLPFRFVMSALLSMQITKTRSTFYSRMVMIAVLSGVALSVVATCRRLRTLLVLPIWMGSRVLSTCVTRALGTRNCHVGADIDSFILPFLWVYLLD